jgi:hypothetical protein
VKSEIRKYLAEIGRRGGLKGGKARMAQLTAEERSELARQAVNARWAQQKKTTTKKGKRS